jgi:hypothetical protein
MDIRWVGHTKCIIQQRVCINEWFGYVKGIEYLRYLGVVGKMVLKCNLIIKRCGLRKCELTCLVLS